MKVHRLQGAVVVTAGADPNDVPQLRLTPDTAVLRPRRDVLVDVKFRVGGAATLMETSGQTAGGLVMATTIWHAPASTLTLGILAELATRLRQGIGLVRQAVGAIDCALEILADYQYEVSAAPQPGTWGADGPVLTASALAQMFRDL